MIIRHFNCGRALKALAAILLLAAAVCVPASCKKGGGNFFSEISSIPGAVPDSALSSAQWNGIRAYVLDSSMSRLPNSGALITLEGSSSRNGARLVLSSEAAKMPFDLYVQLDYDKSKWKFERAEYLGGMGESAISLAVSPYAGRVDAGIAVPKFERDNSPSSSSLDKKLLFEFVFAEKADVSRKSVSGVPSNPVNKVENLTAIDSGSGSVLLTWNEKNVGDYDNSGEVGVPDITPIALHYLETFETSPNPELFSLIDGDANGEIGIPDITPIAQNYLSLVGGYMVYRADLGGEPLPPGSSDSPSAIRPVPSSGQGRVPYQFSDSPPESGIYTYTVRPFSSPSDEVRIGIVSNTAIVSYSGGQGGDNSPPEWESQPGITDAIAGKESILVKWGRAIDSESPPVFYDIYVSAGNEISFNEPDKFIVVPAGDPDDAEHSLQIWDLPKGDTFTAAIRARDSAAPPNRDDNTNTITVKLVESIGWLEFRGGPGRTGAISQSLNPPLTMEFAHTINASAIQSKVSPAIVENPGTGKIYALCALDATVYCLDVTDFDDVFTEWSFTAGDWIESGIAISGGRVYFGGRDNKMYCRDAFTGEQVWTRSVDGTIASSAVVVGDIVFSATANSELLMLSALDGNKFFSYFAPAAISSSPAVENGKVFIGTGDSAAPANIVCFNTATNAESWRFATPAGVPATPAVADGFVLAGDLSGNFHIATTTGALLRSIPLDGSIHASASYANGVAYVATRNGKVYAIEVSTGDFVWPSPASIPGLNGVTASPLLTGGYLYVAAGNGRFYCFDAATGQNVWDAPAGIPIQIIASPCAWRNVVYVLCGDKTLRAFSSNVDLIAPSWITGPGIIAADWTGAPEALTLRLLAGEAFDELSPPVRWIFFMSSISAVDFDTPGVPPSSTIAFAPTLFRDYVLSPVEMTVARQHWTSHRAWYGARAMDNAIPPNVDGNTVVLDYTFPWTGFDVALAADTGEKFYRFDGAYDDTSESAMIVAYTLDNGIWKLKQYVISGAETEPVELLPLVNKASVGYVDIAPGNAQSDNNYYAAVVVPVTGDPVKRDLYLGVTDSHDEAFTLQKISSEDRFWGQISISVDNRGLPAVASTYWEPLTEPTYPTLFPQYHFIDDGIPPAWRREFIDQSGVQTRYINLAFKKDGTPIVAYTRSNLTTGNRTGLFVAERIGENNWQTTPVADGAMLGTTGKHLSMLLDENDRPIIAFTDLEAEMMLLALPVANGEWDVIQLGDLNNAGVLAHHETSLVHIPGAGPGDGTADYALAHYSTFGGSSIVQKVFVRAFGKSGGNWVLPENNTYWLGETDQPPIDNPPTKSNSGSILILPRGEMLGIVCADELGGVLLRNEMRLEHLLR